MNISRNPWQYTVSKFSCRPHSFVADSGSACPPFFGDYLSKNNRLSVVHGLLDMVEVPSSNLGSPTNFPPQNHTLSSIPLPPLHIYWQNFGNILAIYSSCLTPHFSFKSPLLGKANFSCLRYDYDHA